MEKSNILIIDDDQTLSGLLSDHLKNAGFTVHTAANGATGLETFHNVTSDIVILDVMMPELDGWEVCRRLREVSSIPIIMLSAKGEEFDKLRGFNLGVDDYVTKPFSFAELSARIKAVLSRSLLPEDESGTLAFGDLTINPKKKLVEVNGLPINLTPTEYKLLETLAKSKQRTLPQETILLRVWGKEYAGETEHVKHYIWSLRKKIEQDPGNPRHILTERGFGYRLE